MRILRILWNFIVSLFKDGSVVVSIIAPVLSISFTAAKAFDAPMDWLKSVSYAWVFLPLLIWLLVAYLRRWFAHWSLLQEYAYSLDISQIDTVGTGTPPSTRGIVFHLYLKNAIDRKIKYTFSKVAINGVEQDQFDTRGGVAREKETRHFFTPDFPLGSGSRPNFESFRLELQIDYGPPDGDPVRRTTKILQCDVNLTAQSTTFRYLTDTDIEFPAD